MTRLQAIAAACRAASYTNEPYYVIAEGDLYYYCSESAREIFYSDCKVVFTTTRKDH